MSEYASSKKTQTPERSPAAPVLFEDDTFMSQADKEAHTDALVDEGVANYYEARLRTGMDQLPVEGERGAYVLLSDRAVAIDAIMHTFEKHQPQYNKARGAEKQLERVDSPFRRKFPTNGGDVVQGMYHKAYAGARADNETHFRTLTGATALARAGFDNDSIHGIVNGLSSDMERAYGLGQSTEKRERLKAKIKRS